MKSKPVKTKFILWPDGIERTLVCPDCEESVGNLALIHNVNVGGIPDPRTEFVRPLYCWNCGQLLDWSPIIKKEHKA